MDYKKIFLLTIIAGTAGLGIYFGFGLLRRLQTTPDISTIVIDYSANFEPVRLQETRNYTVRSERPWENEPFLIQIGEDIIYHEKNQGVNVLDDPIIVNSLQRINATNGEIVWQQELDGIVREVTNNAKYVFIAFSTQIRPGFDSAKNLVNPGAIKVTAFDIESGTAVWSGIYYGFAYTSYMDANEEIIGIHGHNGHYAFPGDIFIDAQTGNLTEEKLTGFGSNENIPSELSEKGIRSLNWEKLSHGNFVAAAATSIYAHSSDSESTLWRINTGLVVTNFAVDQGTIFFLTEEAALWAVDEISGQVTGKVQFKDNNPFTNWAISQYLVSADEGTVVIFSRDTQYLFVFRFFAQSYSLPSHAQRVQMLLRGLHRTFGNNG